MDFSLLLSSYATVWSNPEVLLMTFIGALGGVLLGAIPGMTATMGVALLIPFSFGMDLIPSIGLLLGIYCGGMYGGSISAILIHAGFQILAFFQTRLEIGKLQFAFTYQITDAIQRYAAIVTDNAPTAIAIW